jgi:hypothetical protein
VAVALVIEDGTGIASANTYQALDAADTYHESVGSDAWFELDLSLTVASADAGADTISVVGHGLIDGERVRLAGADLPAPLVAATDYWVIVVDSDTLKLAESEADALDDPPVPVPLSDAGSGVMTLTCRDVNARYVDLIAAAKFLDRFYGRRYIGTLFDEDQGLLWPRSDAVGLDGRDYSEVVPAPLKEAQAELALRHHSDGDLAPDPTESSVKTKKEKVGPIEEQTSFAVPTSAVPKRPVISATLSPILRSSDRVVRA